MAFLAALPALFSAGAGVAGTLSTVAGLAGTALTAVGTIASGRQAEKAAEYEAQQLEMRANETRAASQREAAAQYRQGEIMASQQAAGIAGSGGDLSDASVIDLMGDTAAEVDLARRTTLYRGENQARGLQDAAQNTLISGQNARTNSYIGAGTQLFSGISNMYTRFGAPQRKTSTARNATAPLYG